MDANEILQLLMAISFVGMIVYFQIKSKQLAKK